MALALLAGCTQHGHSNEPVATQEINIPGQWIFEPEVAQVVAGKAVTWTNNGGAAHTVTIPALGVDENLRPGESFEYVFEEPGTYAYECSLHPPGMVGRIIAVPSASPSSSSVGTTANSSASNSPTEA